MLLRVAAFEFRQNLRSPLFWAVFAIFFLIAFGATTSDAISIGESSNIHKNAPYVTLLTHLVMTMFFMFAAVAFVAGAVIRDDETGFGPILRAAPLSKFDYLYGRFAGGFAGALLAFAGLTTGLIVGSFMPWIDPEKLGPFRPDAYAFAYFVMAAPTLFFTSALFFALATATRSYASVFVAVIGILVAYVFARVLLGKPELEPLAAPWDPIGSFVFGVTTRYWTAADRNTLLPALSCSIACS